MVWLWPEWLWFGVETKPGAADCLATQYQTSLDLRQPYFSGTDSANWEQNCSDWWVWLGPASESGLHHALQDGQNDGRRDEAETSTDPSHQVEPFFFLILILWTWWTKVLSQVLSQDPGTACCVWVTRPEPLSLLLPALTGWKVLLAWTSVCE